MIQPQPVRILQHLFQGHEIVHGLRDGNAVIGSDPAFQQIAVNGDIFGLTPNQDSRGIDEGVERKGDPPAAVGIDAGIVAMRNDSIGRQSPGDIERAAPAERARGPSARRRTHRR